ncbi:fibrobacter succinogenes major paralogous domain-containing protein [Fibrobacter sp.]
MKNLWCHPGLRSSSPVRQAQDRLRRGSIHIVFALILAAFFVACSDNDGDVATQPSGDSSPSVCNDCEDGSSSSVTPQSSSSSKVPELVEGSSSSTISSSSSVTLATPCKTETVDNCEYGELTDDRDGKKYKTVKIGDQWWMAENLNYETESSDCFSYGDTNCVKYGRLYAWGDAMDSAGTWSTNGKGCGRFGKDCSPIYPVRGICPNGWHLPDTTEWGTLLAAVGGREIAGKKLKSMSGWYDYKGEKGDGTDDFGFSALPAGLLGDDGYYDEGEAAYFWSSMHRGNLSAYDVFLCNQRDAVSMTVSYNNIDAPVSVRCVKDDVPGQTAQFSSSSVTLATPCKTDSTDTCEYGELVDDRNGQIYKTVKIDDQWWMAENLNFKTDSSFCYNDSAEYCEKYGRLYMWGAASSACPSGWHLPDTTEWKTLINAVGGQSTAGNVLKSMSGRNSSDNGTDDFGFSALPTGYRNEDGDYFDEGSDPDFWSSTENGNSYAYHMDLGSGDYAYLGCIYKVDGFPVRCLKD